MIIILLLVNILQYHINNNYRPLPSDAVPNEVIAKQIADVIQVSVLKTDPTKLMNSEVTYDKMRKVWVVIIKIPELGFGSDCKIVIRKKDAKIMEVSKIN